MAIKTPIISIDVDDGAFQRFAALFARYQAQLKQMPVQWKTIGDEVDAVLDKTVTGAEGVTDAAEGTAAAAAATAVSFRQTFISVGGAADQADKVSKSSRDAAVSARAQASAWHNMARDARSFAGQVGDATRSLLRWAGLTGVISGILGAGGLFGIDRLAGAAGNARRSALGLGVTPGEEKAFDVNYGRVVDPTAFLSGVNDALHDVTKRHTLYGAGLSERDLAGKDTAQVSADLLPALKRIADQTPAALLSQVLQSRGLDQFISLQDFERLKATPAAEIASYGQRYQKDVQALDLNQQQLKAWQDLQVQLARAGATIEKTFITGLAPLAPQIENLSAAFTKAVGDLLSSPQLREWIGDLASGIKWLADYMLTDAFHDKVLAFVKGVGEFVSAIGSAITAIEGWVAWFRGDAPGSVQNAIKNGGVNGPLTDDNENAPGSPAFNRKRFPERYNDDGTPKEDDQPSAIRRWWYKHNASPDSSPDAHKEEYRKLEGDNALPAGLLTAVERRESGFKDVLSDAGAQGYFQFMPAAAGRYNVNPHDEISSATGAAHYFKDLLAEFKGDIAKAAAAYNWGEGHLEKDIAQYGEKWREHLPAETANYVNSVTTQIANTTNNHGGGQGRAMIRIENNTGGNATVSTSQLVN